jgi:hypothetical protein
MNRAGAFPLRSALLAAILVLGSVGELASPPPAAHAQVLVVNVVGGLAHLLSAGARRRGTYIAADQTQQDFNRYYDSLRNTARTQLVSGELQSLRSTSSGLQAVRVGAYVKLDAALRAEQAAVTRAIEAEKNEARRNFNRTVVQTLTNLVLSTPGAQQLLGQVRTVLSNLRASVVALQSAIAAGRPFEAIREQLASQVQSSAEVRNLVRNLGTMAGQQLDQAMGGALTRMDQALSQAQQEMEAAATSLNSLDAQVAALSTARPNVLTSDRTGLPFNIRMTDRANAALDAASSAIAFISGLQGSHGTTRDEMYQQIRSQMLQEHNAGLLHPLMSVRTVTCTGVGRGEYEVAMGMLGRTPATVLDPEDAAYIVCTDRESGQPVRAYIVGGGIEPTATPGEGTPTAEPNIPAGTYTGTTTYLLNIEPEYRGVLTEDKLTVIIDPDGTVWGTMSVKDDRTVVITKDCTVSYHHEFAGELSGRLASSEGEVDLHSVSSGISDHCDGSSEPWVNPPIEVVVSIRVVGGILTGEVLHWDRFDGGTWTFTAERQ